MEKFAQPIDRFGSIANDYDNRMSEEDYHAPGLIACQLRAHFERAAKARPYILDLGAGTGLLGERVKEIMPGANLTAIDLSGPMLQEAKKKRVYFVLHQDPVPGGLARFRDGTFDAVMSCGATEYIADTDGVAAGASRILKPGGVACMSFLLSTEPYLDLLTRRAYYYPKTARAETKEDVLAAFERHGMAVTSDMVTTGYNDIDADYKPDYYIVTAVKTPTPIVT